MNGKLARIQWYLNRLSSMSRGEIVYRVQQQMGVQREKYLGYGFREKRPIPRGAWHSFLAGDGCTFFITPGDRDTRAAMARRHFPEGTEATIRLADRVLEGQIALFGVEVLLNDPIQWHKDPKTGRSWPADVFWSDIDIRDGRTVGGVKWVWELNRHHHIVTLAKAYYLSQNEQYAWRACQDLTSWLDQNQFGRGVNWTSSLELALRLINWSWALAFLRGCDALQQPLFERLLTAVQAQASYIERHLSKYSSANNHLVGEAVGMLFAGICFPYFDESVTWRDKGLRIIGEQIPLQLLPDGTPAEQTIEYLTFLLDFNFQALRLAALNSLPLPAIWHERLAQVAHFVHAVLRPDGSFPTLGDGDDAWVVRLDDTGEQSRLRSFLVLIALELDPNAAVPFRDEKTFWLYGEAAVDAPLASLPAPASTNFSDGGLVVMRHAETVVTFDYGPLGYLETAAHGHADALHVTLSQGSTPLLIDPNTFAYQEGYEWRDFFRSTAAHNTIVVDGKDQSEMQGAFLWGRKAEARLLAWKTAASQDHAVAQHNGYAQIGVIHQRDVRFDKPNQLVVTDTLRGDGTHNVALYWHLAPHALVEQMDEKVVVRVEAAVLTVAFELPDASVLDIIQGATRPIQGWASPHYGKKVPAPVLAISGLLRLPAVLKTRLTWQQPMPG